MLNRVICGNDILAYAKSLAIKALYIKWKPLSQLKRLSLTDFVDEQAAQAAAKAAEQAAEQESAQPQDQSAEKVATE